MSISKMGVSNLFIFTFTFFVFIHPDLVDASKPDRVLYRDLGTLYFYPGEMTRARRTHPVRQLVCLKGCQYPQPRSVKCENVGWDGSSNLWRCTAELDSAYSLDRAEVVCEGYNSPDDAFVTAGSCSLEYSIKRKGGSGSEKTGQIEPPGLTGVFFILFFLFVLYVMYKSCVQTDENQHNRSYTNNDGPDDGQGPQQGPRMGWNIPGMNQRRRGHSPGYGTQARDDTCGGNNNAAGGGGPGFWSGLAAGGLLGSMFSGSGRNSGYQNSQPSYFNQRPSGLYESGTSGGSDGYGGMGSDSGSTSQSEVTARYRQR